MKGRRLAAFIAAAFAGIFIIMAAVMMWIDFRSIWEQEDSFLNTDYIAVNHKASAGASATPFTGEEINDIKAQPWVRRVGEFKSADFRVSAAIRTPAHSFSTMLFFESVPDEFLDIPRKEWRYDPDSDEIPVILSKSYLTLYNFGFAHSAGTPQISEQLLSSIPLDLEMTSNDGSRRIVRRGRIVALSNRLNTILVPEDFMKDANARLGSGEEPRPGRLMIDVSRPGDSAIAEYLADHRLESGSDDGSSSATYLLRVAAIVAASIGGLIALLSGVILTLSISLLLERNRERIARLKMLGYRTSTIGRPFRALCLRASALSWIFAVIFLGALQLLYRSPLISLGGSAAGFFPAAVVGLVIATAIFAAGVLTVRKSLK